MKSNTSILTSLALCLIALVLTPPACTTTGQGYGNNSGSPIGDAVQAMFPRTSRSIERIAQRNAGNAIPPTWEQEQAYRRYQANNPSYRNQRYAQNTYQEPARYNNENDYRNEEEYQDYLNWKDQQIANNGPSYQQAPPQAPSSYPGVVSNSTPDYDPDADAPFDMDEFYNFIEAKGLGTREEIEADIQANGASNNKLPWESEEEYRSRLSQSLAKTQARAQRYSQLANQ